MIVRPGGSLAERAVVLAHLTCDVRVVIRCPARGSGRPGHTSVRSLVGYARVSAEALQRHRVPSRADLDRPVTMATARASVRGGRHILINMLVDKISILIYYGAVAVDVGRPDS